MTTPPSTLSPILTTRSAARERIYRALLHDAAAVWTVRDLGGPPTRSIRRSRADHPVPAAPQPARRATHRPATDDLPAHRHGVRTLRAVLHRWPSPASSPRRPEQEST